MKLFCIHQDKQSPFYGTVGHIADPDDLLGTSRTVCQGIFDPYDLLGEGHGCKQIGKTFLFMNAINLETMVQSHRIPSCATDRSRVITPLPSKS